MCLLESLPVSFSLGCPSPQAFDVVQPLSTPPHPGPCFPPTSPGLSSAVLYLFLFSTRNLLYNLRMAFPTPPPPSCGQVFKGTEIFALLNGKSPKHRGWCSRSLLGEVKFPSHFLCVCVGIYSVAEDDLLLMVLQLSPRPPTPCTCWDSRCAPPHLASFCF